MTFSNTLLLFLFILGGISLKIADYSGETPSKTIPFISASITAIIFGVLMSYSPVSSSIIVGIILGVLFSGKIDQYNLLFGLVVTFVIAYLLHFHFPILWLLAIVAVISFIDELFHDRVSSKNVLLTKVFRFHPLLKITFLVLTSLSMIKVMYTAGFFGFDLAYDITNVLLTKYVTKQNQ